MTLLYEHDWFFSFFNLLFLLKIKYDLIKYNGLLFDIIWWINCLKILQSNNTFS